MTNRTLEKKAKRTLWQDIKLAAKVGVITSLFMQPAIQNVGGYISTNSLINRMDTQGEKKYIAEFERDFYKNHQNGLGKILHFGDYLAANQYLQNKQ